MNQFFGFFILFSIAISGEGVQTTNAINIIKHRPSITDSIPYGFSSAYEISKEHQPFMVTGYFNPDNVTDTAILIQHRSTAKDALFIKHGGTNRSFLLKTGKDLGADFEDFHWVEQFEVIKKGTKIWNNVIDGEIVTEDRVPDNKKINLQTDAIFIHEGEGGGGGIIYFKSGKYVWLQQD